MGFLDTNQTHLHYISEKLYLRMCQYHGYHGMQEGF